MPRKPKSEKPKRAMSVADFINQKLAASPKSQRQIAEECGWTNPNVISLLKASSIKLPINKVRLLANSLEIDPKYLFRLCMEEYNPEAWEVMQELLGGAASVSDEEMEIIGVMRQAHLGYMPSMSIEKNRESLLRLTQTLVKEELAEAQAVADIVNKMPRNKRGKVTAPAAPAPTAAKPPRKTAK